jgi:glucose/arabinose dehydrogenase
MKRFLTLIAATAALGLAAFAYAAGPEDQAGAAQPSPAAQPSMPSTDPATQSDPAATAQSSASTAQSTRLAAIVPAGMSAQEACTGFRSVAECAATLHVSQNLSIPFPDLKSKVTGGAKLGAAIHQLKPDANVKAELRKAEEQARSDTRSPQG